MRILYLGISFITFLYVNEISQFREFTEECTDIIYYYHGEDIPGYVPLGCLNTWSQSYCRIGSACPPNEAATNVVTNDRASYYVGSSTNQ